MIEVFQALIDSDYVGANRLNDVFMNVWARPRHPVTQIFFTKTTFRKTFLQILLRWWSELNKKILKCNITRVY